MSGSGLLEMSGPTTAGAHGADHHESKRTGALEHLALMRRIAERRTTQRLAAEQLGLTVRQLLVASSNTSGRECFPATKRARPAGSARCARPAPNMKAILLR